MRGHLGWGVQSLSAWSQAGVELDEKSRAVVVNKYSQSSVPSIWAVGDVTDRVALTPVALMEVRRAPLRLSMLHPSGQTSSWCAQQRACVQVEMPTSWLDPHCIRVVARAGQMPSICDALRTPVL